LDFNYRFVLTYEGNNLTSKTIQNWSEEFGYRNLIKEEYSNFTTLTQSSEKQLLSFSFEQLTPIVNAVINQETKTIAVEVPQGTNLSNLVASFTVSPFASVKIDNTLQTSGVTANNFAVPVVYTVIAQDGTTSTYTVNTIITDVQNIANQSIKLYPNPTSKLFIVETDEVFEIEIINMNGQTQLKNNLSNGKTSIDVSRWNEGLYIVRIKTDKGLYINKLNVVK